QVPRALGFVEHRYMLRWRARVLERVITEMMHVLNERLDAFGNLSLANFLATRCPASYLVPDQRLAQHRNERTIAGEKHRVLCFNLVPVRRDVQADKGLARTRHAGNETDGFAALRARLVNDLLETTGRLCEIHCA